MPRRIPDEVQDLITGPAVFICDGCVYLRADPLAGTGIPPRAGDFEDEIITLKGWLARAKKEPRWQSRADELEEESAVWGGSVVACSGQCSVHGKEVDREFDEVERSTFWKKSVALNPSIPTSRLARDRRRS